MINVAENNVIYVGQRPADSYAFNGIMLFGNGADEVVIKARGMAIKRAVDVAEIIRKRMEDMMKTEIKYKDVRISTEKVQRENGERNVSAIEIVLSK